MRTFVEGVSLSLGSLCAEFDLDSGDFDEASSVDSGHRSGYSSPGRGVRRPIPLLPGFMEAIGSGRAEALIPMYEPAPQEDRLDDLDLEELAAKRTAGGGMFDSIANMANSILGAG